MLYNFRTRKAFDLLYFNDFNIVNIISPDIVNVINRFKETFSLLIIIIIIIYSVIIKVFYKFEIIKFAIINEYRLYHINIKNVIAFISLRIKKYYDVYYQFKYFNIDDLINLKFHKKYQIFIIKFKKIDF